MSRQLIRLSKVHPRLEDELQAEMRRREPRMTRVARLKKMKLAIKDRLAASTARSIAL